MRLAVLLGIVAISLISAGCARETGAGPETPPRPNAAGLTTLPCRAVHLRPASRVYCLLGRHYVTPSTRAVVIRAADTVAARYPGSAVLFMDASGADGHRPFAPHLSHGDGREIDLALFYADRAGHPLDRPPTLSGYGAYEPPRPGETRACKGQKGPTEPDPPAGRPWRLDAARTRALVLAITDDPGVRRVFLEPHLKHSLGLAGDDKVRFQGCWAARHDDHLHVDFR